MKTIDDLLTAAYGDNWRFVLFVKGCFYAYRLGEWLRARRGQRRKRSDPRRRPKPRRGGSRKARRQRKRRGR